MDTYVILRRGGWRSPEDLREAAARSQHVGDEQMSDDIRWIRSYVLEEDGGSVGTVRLPGDEPGGDSRAGLAGRSASR
jgi:hypothetical protein